LEKFVASYGSATPAVDARLDLSRACFQLKRYDEALKWGQKALDEMPGAHGLKAVVLYQVALTLEAMGKSEEALKQWSALKAEGIPGVGREVEWHLAKLHAAKGDLPKAVGHYEQAIQASGSYPSTSILEQELASVRAKMGGSATAAP